MGACCSSPSADDGSVVLLKAGGKSAFMTTSIADSSTPTFADPAGGQFGGLQESFPIQGPAAKVGPLNTFNALARCPVGASMGEWTLKGDGGKGSTRSIVLEGNRITELCTNVKPNGYSYALTEGGEDAAAESARP